MQAKQQIQPHRTPMQMLFDVAIAQAARRPSERITKVTISDANAKGAVQVAVESHDPDPVKAAQQADDLYASLRAKYPRDNGTEGKP